MDWWRWVPEPTPIPISSDRLVPHRPAQLGVVMGALQSCTGLDAGAGCLWVEIGAGQAIEADALVKEVALLYFVGEADGGGDVLDNLVMMMKVISEVGGGGKNLMAEVAVDAGGSHGDGRLGLNSDRRYLFFHFMSYVFDRLGLNSHRRYLSGVGVGCRTARNAPIFDKFFGSVGTAHWMSMHCLDTYYKCKINKKSCHFHTMHREGCLLQVDILPPSFVDSGEGQGLSAPLLL
jgi:hypothetical protein